MSRLPQPMPTLTKATMQATKLSAWQLGGQQVAQNVQEQGSSLEKVVLHIETLMLPLGTHYSRCCNTRQQ